MEILDIKVTSYNIERSESGTMHLKGYTKPLFIKLSEATVMEVKEGHSMEEL